MPSNKTPRRILIAAECFVDAEAAIRLADQVLAASPADLGGLLMDDDLWATIFRLPEQRVVTLAGSMMDLPSGQKVQSLRASDARAFQERLSAVAHARSVNWSFERRRGDLMHTVFEVAKSWDILLLGYRDLHNRPGQVVLIDAGSEKGGRAQALAYDIALALNTSVLKLSLSSEDEESETTEAQLLSQLSRVNAATVVVDLSASPFRTEDQLRQALDASRCPVVILGSEQNPIGDEPATVKPALEQESVGPEGSE